METITNLRTKLSKDDWIVAIDISVSHFTSRRGIQGLCSSPVSGSELPISVHAFRPKRCRKGFDRVHEVSSCGQSKNSRLQGSSQYI